MTDERPTTTTQLAHFAQAAVEVALDCDPGGDDDVARDFGLSIVDTGLAGGGLVVTLEDRRRFALTFSATELEPAPPAPDPLATNVAEGGALCTFTRDGVTCAHTGAVHVDQGAVASDRGAWCMACDADPERVDVNELVHHDYSTTTTPPQLYRATFIVTGDDVESWREQIGSGAADIYADHVHDGGEP